MCKTRNDWGEKTKIRVPKTYFFDIVNTHNDYPSYGKHVLGSMYLGIWCGGGGGASGRLVQNLLMKLSTLLMQFSTVYNSNIEASENIGYLRDRWFHCRH